MIRKAYLGDQPVRSAHAPDELSAEKQQLLNAESDIPIDLVRRYPKSAAAAAFSLGIAAGCSPFVRHALWVAGTWTAQYLARQWMVNRR